MNRYLVVIELTVEADDEEQAEDIVAVAELRLVAVEAVEEIRSSEILTVQLLSEDA